MKRKFVLIPVLLIAALGVVAQQPARVRRDVKYLASDKLEGRLTGSKGATEAARYIANEFKKAGLKPLAGAAGNGSESRHAVERYLQTFTYVARMNPHNSPPPEGNVSPATEAVRNETPAYNVAGMLEGSDPVLKNEVIIIGAHYDHLGRGGEGSGSLAPRSGDIHYGADDNASGTAGVLELARLFTAQKPRPKRTILFIAFSGEEEGLLGSNYYVNHPLLPLANTVAMINMDMIGRMKDSRLIIGGVGTAKEWRDMMAADADKSFQLTLTEDGFGPSDHSSFYAKQIPVLFFWTGTHNDYHKPSDTFDKINYDDEARILEMVARIVNQLDAADKRVTYTTAKSDPAPRTGGFRVYLGTIPNYADSNDGLLLDGVRDDSPAAKAGLKAGDKVVKIGDHDIRNVYDYTAALGEMKAGEEYVFEVKRGDQKLLLKVVPQARK